MKLKYVKEPIVTFCVIFGLSLIAATQASAAWTKSESSRVKALERKVKELEEILEENINSQELITVRYLSTGSQSGLLKDICPGDNFEDPQFPTRGRISTGTDLTGSATSRAVYGCTIQFYARKN